MVKRFGWWGVGAIVPWISIAGLSAVMSAVSSTVSVAKDVSQTIPKTPIENLKSERLIDYEPLQTLLRQGKWAEANAMTSNLLLQASDKLDQGYLRAEDIRLMPCQDFLTIDRLWRYYSHDRFGYSVQAGIWWRMYGKDAKDAKGFEGKVGWYRGIVNPTLHAQVGHLPLRPASNGGSTDAWGGAWIAEMPQRLSVCLNPPKPSAQKLSTPLKKAIGSKTPTRSPKPAPKKSS